MSRLGRKYAYSEIPTQKQPVSPGSADTVEKLAYLENTPFLGYRNALPTLRKSLRIAYRRSDFH
jgi:hypothetical protein